MDGIDGDGEKLGLVGSRPTDGHADVEVALRQQEAGDTRRRQQARNVLPRPAGLAHRRERLAVETRRPVEIDRAQGIEDEPGVHRLAPSLDRAAGAVRQGDVDPAQVKWPRQAIGAVSSPPGLDAVHEGKAPEHGRIGRPVLRDGIDAGSPQRRGERRHVLSDDQAFVSGETRREVYGRCRERRRIIADGGEPVAELRVDGRNHQPFRRRRLGAQYRRCGKTSQGKPKSDGQTARGGQSHAHAGETARTGCDRNQVEPVSRHASLLQRSSDRRQETRRLVAPFLEQAHQANAVAHDGNTLPAHGAIEGQDSAHVASPRRTLAPTRTAGHCGVMKLDIVPIAPPDFDVDVTLAYATEANLTGRPVYRNAECWLHREAADKLAAAIALARPLGYRLRIFDALRPVEAQWALWNVNPDPEFIADPRRGSPHSRGVAVDLSLLDPDGNELDMGTAFDAFTPLSHHGRTDISVGAQRNRLLLMGLMTSAGWDFYRNEWWHYQLFDARRYPLVADADLPRPMM